MMAMSKEDGTRGAAEAAAHWDAIYEQHVKSSWISNPLVFEEVCRRMAGQERFWLNWLFEDRLPAKSYRMLSVGCGDGEHELLIARNRWVGSITAFDASPIGIQRAIDTASAEALDITFRVQTFDEFVRSDVGDPFDLIMFAGALHHVREMEEMLAKCQSCLSPNGYLVLNEYIGPCYNIYPPSQVRIINAFLKSLAPEYKRPDRAKWVNPSIATALAADPSESVRSSLIMELVPLYFEVETARYYGGALLHPIIDCLNGAKLADGTPASTSIVRMLIEAENLLSEAGVLQQNFCFAVCRHKP